jgi:signal transduction histidine kinase
MPMRRQRLRRLSDSMLPEHADSYAPDGEAPPLRADFECLRNERALLCDLLAAPADRLAQFMAAAAYHAPRIRSLLGKRAREPVEYLRKVAQLRRICLRLARLAGTTPLPSVVRLYEHTADSLAVAGTAAMGDGLLPALSLIEEGFLTLSMISERTGISLAARTSRPSRERRRALHQQAQAKANTKTKAAAEDSARSQPPAAQSRLEMALRQLCDKLTGDHSKRIELSLMGIEDVPEDLFSSIYDMLAQLLRNAIEHGIETPAERTGAGKNPAGSLLIQFSIRGGQAELIFQDDGQGLQASQILKAGIERGLIDNDSQLALDPRQASSLIFYPGISTAADKGGRGLGMGIVRDHVKRMGGRIQVATKREQFTRIRVRLPWLDARNGGAVAARA